MKLAAIDSSLDIEKISSLCKRRGFVYQSSEIYGGLASTWDYGPLGVELKRNVKDHWWNTMVWERDDMVGLDASILMHPDTWRASGHLESFTDPLVECSDCNRRYREDHIETKVCPECSGALTEPRLFHLMFKTFMGPVEGDASTVYLRPETAQGIFLNFLNVINSTRVKVPFGIAQIGKAFRNEIIARQFVFRMREFEQMEMQFFVEPGKEMNFYDDWKDKRMKWHKSLDLGDHLYRFHNHENLAHYANAACDIEFLFPMGFKELEGIHSRTDFDLKSHQKLSGKKINYYDQKTKSSFIPYVIETSVGLDRLFLSVLSASYQNQKLKNGTERIFLKIPFEIAPIKAAILPLNAKDNLPEKAKLLYDELKTFFNIQYDEKDSIGKRYRRQDAIGTPYCITFDYDTLKDNSVTIRNRNSMVQDRVLLSSTKDYIINNVSIDNLLTQV